MQKIIIVLASVLLWATSAFAGFDPDKIKKHISLSHQVLIAASNSTDEAKAAADVICPGKNDEQVIQEVLDFLDGDVHLNCAVILSEGDYIIGSFRSFSDTEFPTALRFGVHSTFRFMGADAIVPMGNGVRFMVQSQAYENQESDTQLQVMAFSNKNGLNQNQCELSNFSIYLPDIKHKVICVNTFNAGGLILQNIRLICEGRGFGRLPIEGLIGVRGQHTNPNGVGQYWKDVRAMGFYEAFQMGGEHTVAVNLLGYESYYGYTFGNYPMSGNGVWEHPLTLINCSEELCASLPLFAANGASGSENNPGLQCVDLISHTMEFRREENCTQREVLPARETIPGTWCGNITFAANRLAKSFGNAVDIKFWEEGSGVRFKTRNSAHAVAGTTKERLSYVPTYVQTYYDTDLNKMVIFNGKEWVDANGQAVDEPKKDRFAQTISLGSHPDASLNHNWGDGWFYSLQGNLSESTFFLRSQDLAHWEKTDICPLSKEVLSELSKYGKRLSAPSFLKTGSGYVMYLTVSDGKKSQIAVLQSPSLTGKFKLLGWMGQAEKGTAYYEGGGSDRFYGLPWLLTTKNSEMQVQRIERDGVTFTPGGQAKTIAKEVTDGTIYWDKGYWFLFAVRDGMIISGRSDQPNGPYLDRSGKDLTKGGGDALIKADQISDVSFDHDNRNFLIKTINGQSVMQEIKWTEDLWPRI